jgi:subfamily B ATP-binding cassette protein MsbA
MAKNRSFHRILGYVKPYWFSLLLNLFFNLMTIFFSLFSFALLVPFLNLLFKTEVVEVVAKPDFSFSSEYLMSYLNYYMSSLIHDHGQRYALVFICIVLLIAFFVILGINRNKRKKLRSHRR